MLLFSGGGSIDGFSAPRTEILSLPRQSDEKYLALLDEPTGG